MVWLHGGGFSQGSASAPVFDGTNLARRSDVVVVGINHRLNVLGYAYLAELGGSDFAKSGNAGILDIVQALQWVRDNIDRFGGDPKNVMIFGESGGGSKVCTLMAMPCAKGLFHRQAIQSGPGIRSMEPEAATKLAEGLLAELGLAKSQVRELQSLPLEKIMAAYFARSGGVGMGMRGFAPVVDGDSLPRHPFSPDAPSISADVPILVGYNRTEAEFFLLADARSTRQMTDDELERRASRRCLATTAGASLISIEKLIPALVPTICLCSCKPTVGWASILSASQSERRPPASGTSVSVQLQLGHACGKVCAAHTLWKSPLSSTTSKLQNR